MADGTRYQTLTLDGLQIFYREAGPVTAAISCARLERSSEGDLPAFAPE
jgi:hypothetical protein